MRTLSKITKEEIIKAISNSNSYSQVLSTLEVHRSGSNQTALKNFITKYDIDITHFKQNQPKIKQYCLNCGKEIDKRNKFCNNTCHAEYNRKQYIDLWKQGLETGTVGEDVIAVAVRKYMFEKHKNSCQKCGWNQINPFTGLVPLQIHHIDGDCKNNQENNLELLCPNCHALTENFGSRNDNCTRIDKRYR